MSQNAVYRNRQAHLIDETTTDANVGPRIDFGDGLLFRVNWGDPRLIVDPTDDQWFGASPLLAPLPLDRIITDMDGTTSFHWQADHRRR